METAMNARLKMIACLALALNTLACGKAPEAASSLAASQLQHVHTVHGDVAANLFDALQANGTPISSAPGTGRVKAVEATCGAPIVPNPIYRCTIRHGINSSVESE